MGGSTAMMRAVQIAVMLACLSVRCLAGSADGWWIVDSILRQGGAVSVWPDDAPFYSSLYGLWYFAANVDPQPSVKVSNDLDVSATGATWNQATNGTRSYYALNGVAGELTAADGEQANTFAWAGKTGGVWRTYTVENGTKYVNGVAQTFTGNWYATNGNELTWGSANGSGYLACSIAEPMAFGSVFTAVTRFDWHYNVFYNRGFPKYLMDTTDPLAYRPTSTWTNAFGIWNFSDTTSGTVAQDWKGTAHMSGVNTPTSATVNGTNGVMSYASASSEYHGFTVSGYNSSAASGTIVAWVKLNESVNDRTILASADVASATRYFTFYVLPSGQIAISQRNNDTASTIRGNTTLATNQWYQVVGQSSDTAYVFYVNGVLESKTTVAGSDNGDWFFDTSAKDNVTIGAITFSGGTFSYMNGSIDEVLVINSVMSSNEVYNLYQQTRSLFP